ncbi:MAG: cupin [Mesorhizobium amorphae]|nr:MAG: cupin [Mesorhizobium amorphae]
MIDLETFKALAGTELGPWAPKPTSVEGDQQEASRSLWSSADGALDVGVWECTPGRFTADRSASTELCHIISGVAELRRHDGDVRELRAGDLLVLPRGWRGEWVIREQLRKLYVMQSDPR